MPRMGRTESMLRDVLEFSREGFVAVVLARNMDYAQRLLDRFCLMAIRAKIPYQRISRGKVLIGKALIRFESQHAPPQAFEGYSAKPFWDGSARYFDWGTKQAIDRMYGRWKSANDREAKHAKG